MGLHSDWVPDYLGRQLSEHLGTFAAGLPSCRVLTICGQLVTGTVTHTCAKWYLIFKLVYLCRNIFIKDLDFTMYIVLRHTFLWHIWHRFVLQNNSALVFVVPLLKLEPKQQLSSWPNAAVHLHSTYRNLYLDDGVEICSWLPPFL